MIPALEARDLVVTRGGREILHGVDLAVASGDWCTVIGPNGAGKSTLLAAVAGLLPRQGTVRVHGISAEGLAPRARARTMAFVVQSPVVPRGLTVAEYVLLGRTAHAGPLVRLGALDRERTDASLGRLGLTEFASRRIETLSGGERQRAVIARAIVQEAPVLLLDEPTTALDIGYQQDVLDVVDEVRHDLGITVIAVMHDLTLAGQYSDQLVLLDDGRVIATGDPTELLDSDELRSSFGARLEVFTHKGHTLVVPMRRAPVRRSPTQRPPIPTDQTPTGETRDPA